MNRIKAALAAGLALTLLAGCGSEVNGGKTAATVNGEVVTAGLLSFEAHYEESIFNTYYSSMFGSEISFDQELSDGRTYGDMTVDNVLEDIEEDILLAQHAEEYGISLSDEQKAKIDETAQAFFDNNGKEIIDKIGLRKEDLVRSLELDTIREMMYEPVVVDVDTEVSEEEIQRGTITYFRVPAATQEQIDAGEDADAINAEAQEKLNAIVAAVEAAGGAKDADLEAIAAEVDESLTPINNTFLVNGNKSNGFRVFTPFT